MTSRDFSDSPQQDHQINPEAALINVPDVEIEPFAPRQRIPAIRLSEAGDPGPHLVPPTVEVLPGAFGGDSSRAEIIPLLERLYFSQDNPSTVD